MDLNRSRVISILLTTAGAVGVAVVFLASIYAAARVRYHLGPAATGIVAALFCAAAAWVATDESRAMAERVKRTLLDLDWSMKEAAIRAGMDMAQLSRQLSGTEQMSLSRFAEWGDEFWFQFSKRGVEERGALVVTHAELAGILKELQQLSGDTGRWRGAA
jgi:hypothetical protein